MLQRVATNQERPNLRLKPRTRASRPAGAPEHLEQEERVHGQGQEVQQLRPGDRRLAAGEYGCGPHRGSNGEKTRWE